MDEQIIQVAEAFSRKALVYDDFGRDHENLRRMRAKVWQHALGFLRAGDRILELNAGTGSDAVAFARAGYSVLATDISPGMVAQMREKIEREGLQDRMQVRQCSFTQLEQIEAGPYQYVFSNMGGVNCHPRPADIARGLERLLSPGGAVTLVVMPPICLWELAQALRGDLRLATRRMRPGGVLANVEGVRFQTYYFWPGEVARAFGRSFRPLRLQGLAVFTPPADRKSFAARHRRVYRLLRLLDRHLSDRAPFNRWGDFYILTLEYRP